MRRWFAAFLFAAKLAAQGPAPDGNAIVQRSQEAVNRDWQAAPGYDFFERDRVPKGTRTYHVRMIFGSPKRILAAIDGKPLPAAQQAAEQAKLDRAIAQRRAESPAQRARRVAAYRKERDRNRQLFGQLAQAFQFKLEGRQMLGDREVYVLQATPRPGYNPPSLQTRVLTGMRGTLWIDTQTFQWAKVEAEVIHPVSIAGFLARVDPGTRFEVEYTPVSGDIWLPSHFSMRARAKVLYVFSRRDQADETYFGYRKSTAPATSH